MTGASKAQRAKTAERRTRAITLKIAGMDWQAIADQLGYASRGAACTDVTRAMEKNIAAEGAAVEVFRSIQLARLERVIAAMWPQAIRGDTTSAEVVRKTVVDICKIMGLSAPQRHELLTLDALDAQIRQLTDELASDD
ncbi:hypothetical protein [Pseudonocardia sp. T1-2H]|uniref:hypothetical protein n=1 Tax=Pseudonocardia sp. T1-2H TaxID=3128899 RepID=UPI0031016C40